MSNVRRYREYVLYVLFFISVLVLALKLIAPSKVYLVMSDGGVKVYEVPHLYTLQDVIAVAISSSLATASGILLILSKESGKGEGKDVVMSGDGVTEDTIRYWETLKSELEGLERRIVEELIRAGGSMYQSNLVEVLGVPKSTLSTSLAKLESRGIVLRVRKGLRNLVVLTSPSKARVTEVRNKDSPT